MLDRSSSEVAQLLARQEWSVHPLRSKVGLALWTYEYEHEMKSCCFSGMTSTSAQWRRGLHHITTPSCASRFSMSHVSWRQCSRTLWTFQPFSPNDFPSSSSNIAITGLEGPLNRNRGSITSLTLGCAHICSSLQLKTRRLFAPNSRTRQWPISLLNPLLQFKFRRRPGQVQLQGEEQSRVDWWRNHFVWWVFLELKTNLIRCSSLWCVSKTFAKVIEIDWW